MLRVWYLATISMPQDGIDCALTVTSCVFRQPGGCYWLTCGQGHVCAPVMFSGLLAAAQVSQEDRDAAIACAPMAPPTDACTATPKEVLQGIRDLRDGSANAGYASNRMDSLACSVSRAELNGEMMAALKPKDERRAADTQGKGWDTHQGSCALWNGPATLRFKGSQGGVECTVLECLAIFQQHRILALSEVSTCGSWLR